MPVDKPSRILLIALPGIGDALLATPLLRSLRKAYPEAKIDMLVRVGCEAIVKENPDLRKVIVLKSRTGLLQSISSLLRIFRKYQLVVSTATSDRAFSYMISAAPRRISVVPALEMKSRWKYLVTAGRVEIDNTTHSIIQNLRLADVLGIARSYEIVLPTSSDSEVQLDQVMPFPWRTSDYAVVHICPGSHYKRWPLGQWKLVVEQLISKNLFVVFTGGSGVEEMEYVREASRALPDSAVNAAGKLKFPEVTELIRQAKIFVGADTSTTHIAAASGTPTIGIYGPSNIIRWGPWPCGFVGDEPPFSEDSLLQQVNNVVVVRAQCKCLPFHRTCRMHNKKDSFCLEQLPAEKVIEALDIFFNDRKSKGSPA